MRFNLRTLLIVLLILQPVIAVVAAASWHFYRLREGFQMLAAASAQLKPYGGWIDQGQVDGVFYVHLSDTNIDDAQFAELAYKLHRFPPPHVDQSHALQIYAGNTRISDQSIAALRGLPILALDVHGTAVTDASIPTICELPLWDLDLRETNTTDASLSSLSNLQLVKLGVSRSKMTAAGIQKLRDEMPQTQIQ